jgi:PAS domain S-box-containing protein
MHTMRDGPAYSSPLGTHDPADRRASRSAAGAVPIAEPLGLAESDARYRDLLDAAAAWMWEWDAQLRVSYLSPEFGAATGLSPQSLLGRRFEASAGGAEEGRAVSAAIESRRRFRGFVFDVAGDDRHTVRLEIGGTPILDADGAFSGYRGIGRNVTAEVEAERALRECDRRFRRLLETASDWLWQTDANGRLVDVSPGFEAHYGVPVAEFVGLGLIEHASARIDPTMAQVASTAIAAREPFRDILYSHEFAGGRIVWFKSSAIPIFDTDAAFCGYWGVSKDVTAEIEADLELRASEQQFRQALDATADYYWEQDSQYRYTHFSPGYEQLLGIPAADSLGRRLSDSPEISIDPEMGKMVLRAMKAKRPYRDYIYARKMADGRKRWFRSSAAPIFDRNGVFEGYRGASSEITQQVEAEALGRLAQLRLNEAAIHMIQPIVVYDAEGRVAAFNQAFTDLHQAPNINTPVSRDASYRDLAEWQLRVGFHARDDDAEVIDIDRLLEHYHDGCEHTYHLRNDRWMLVIYRRLPGEGRVGLWSDVTVIKHAEAVLRRGQSHLAQAQRISGVGSAVHDLITGIDEWSDELYRILGLEPGSVTPSFATYLRFVHEEDRAVLIARQAAVRRGEANRLPGYRIVRPDGGVRVVQPEMAILDGEVGRTKQLFITFRDVTELRAAEERQRELERQLRHAQKLDALGTLAGGVAHDLNNTLVPVLALSKLVMRRLPAESREHANLETIHRAGERARDLVRQILAFCRKEAPTRQRIDLAALLRESLGMVRAGLPSTIRIDEAIDEVPPLLGEPGPLHQVLLNLVVNAGQAIGGAMGTLSVTLVAGRHALPTGTGVDVVLPAVRLSVSDTGCGMDAATIQRIFEPFFTTKPVGEGTGLGLSVVHGIIAQHGGRIEVESRIGAGTRFDVYLPIHGDEAGEAGRPPAAAGA